MRVEAGKQHVRDALEQPAQRAPLRGAVHQRREHQTRRGFGLAGNARELELVGDALTGHEVDPAAEGAEHVLVAPHHAFGHPRGAARVEDVQVTVVTDAEVALGPERGQRVLVTNRAGRRGLDGPVVDLHEVTQLRKPAGDLGDVGRKRCLVDRGHDVGVVEEVDELVGDVAIVHVDGDGPQLVGREHRLDVLNAVVRVDRDVIALADTVRGEVVGQPIGPRVQLRERDRAITTDQRGPVGNNVAGVLGEISQIESHVSWPMPFGWFTAE